MNKQFLAVMATSLCVATAYGEAQVTTVVQGLDSPCGVARQPETGTIFVAESGAGRVVRIVDGTATPVIVDFPIDVYGQEPSYNVGPLGLVFLDKSTLVVGGGGLKDGQDLLRVYDLSDQQQLPKKASDMIASYALPASGETPGEGNFYGIATDGRAIFATASGDDAQGWVAKATIEEGKVTRFDRYIATKLATGADAPVAATISPRGDLVIGQTGEIDDSEDALLTFYNVANGKMIANFETGLKDITALVYAGNGRLYATDFSWSDASQGGLFELVAARRDGKPAAAARKILPLDKPTAMTAANERTLWITVIGSGEGDQKDGKLLKVELEL